MIETCKYDNCSGCMACVDACPKLAILKCINKHGVVVPVINQELCVDCGICRKVCPQLRIKKHSFPKTCIAAYIVESNKRADSASGGVARGLYETFLEEDDTIVFGVEFKQGMKPVYSYTDNFSVIKKYQGSKYVQADSQGMFKKIAELLQNGMKVLLIATPCVIMASYNFLEVKGVQLEKFYTVDLLCHGVSPESYLLEELEYLSRKYNWNTVDNVTFRSNRKFKNFHFVVSAMDKKGKHTEYNRYYYEDPYFSSFLDGTTLRESCYHCNFSSSNRVGDLTIGDFIGLGENDEYPNVPFSSYNNSLIISNSDKGKELIRSVEPVLNCIKRDFEEAYIKGSSLQEPFKPSKTRSTFLDLYSTEGFMKAIRMSNGKGIKKRSRLTKVTRPIKEIILKIRTKN